MPQKYDGFHGSYILSPHLEDFEKDKAWFYNLTPLEQVSTLANSYIYITSDSDFSPISSSFENGVKATLNKLPPKDFPSVRRETNTENDLEGAIYFSPFFLFLCKHTISILSYYNNLIELAQEWYERLSPNATIINYSDNGESENAYALIEEELISQSFQSRLNRMLLDKTLSSYNPNHTLLREMPLVQDYISESILGTSYPSWMSATINNLITHDLKPDLSDPNYRKQVKLAQLFNEMKKLIGRFALYNYAVALTYYVINSSGILSSEARSVLPSSQLRENLVSQIRFAISLASSDWDLPHHRCGGEWNPHYKIASIMLPFLISGESIGIVEWGDSMRVESDVCSNNPLFPIKYISTIGDLRLESASADEFYAVYSLWTSIPNGRAFGRDWASSRLIISYEPPTNDNLPPIEYGGVDDSQELSTFMNYSRFGFSFGGHKGI